MMQCLLTPVRVEASGTVWKIKGGFWYLLGQGSHTFYVTLPLYPPAMVESCGWGWGPGPKARAAAGPGAEAGTWSGPKAGGKAGSCGWVQSCSRARRQRLRPRLGAELEVELLPEAAGKDGSRTGAAAGVGLDGGPSLPCCGHCRASPNFPLCPPMSPPPHTHFGDSVLGDHSL